MVMLLQREGLASLALRGTNTRYLIFLTPLRVALVSIFLLGFSSLPACVAELFIFLCFEIKETENVISGQLLGV